MSAPEEIFVARVKAIAGVAALIAGRVYPVVPPEGVTLPCVTYEASDNPVNSARGATGTHETRITATLMASTYTDVKTLAAALVGDESETQTPTGLSGWSDADGNVWHLDNQRDEPGGIIAGQDVREYHGVVQEYVVWN